MLQQREGQEDAAQAAAGGDEENANGLHAGAAAGENARVQTQFAHAPPLALAALQQQELQQELQQLQQEQRDSTALQAQHAALQQELQQTQHELQRRAEEGECAAASCAQVL